MIGAQRDYAYVIDQPGHIRQEMDFDPGPGTAGHQVLVRRRADRRRAAAAGAVMSRPARPAAALAVAAACARWPGCGSPAPRRARPRGRGAAGRLAVAEHLAGHRRRHLGRRGDGRLRRPGQQLLAAVHPPGRQHRAGSWSPRPGTADNGGLVLAGAGRALVTGFRPSQNLTYTPLTETSDGGQAWSSPRPARRRAGQRPGRPGRKHRQRAACSRCSPAAPPRKPHPATPAGRRWPPSGPWPRTPAGQPLRPAGAHRRRLHPAWHPAAGRHLHPARHRRHLRRQRTEPGRPPGRPLPAALARQQITVQQADPDRTA